MKNKLWAIAVLIAPVLIWIGLLEYMHGEIQKYR